MHRLTSLLLLGLLLCPLSMADADQYCWRFQNGTGQDLLDTLQVSVEAPLTAPQIFGLFVSWKALPLYEMGGTGTATQSGNDGTKYLFTVPSTHNFSDFFNGNRTCGLTMLLNALPGPDFLHGLWSAQCTGGPGGSSNPSGKVRFFECPVLPGARLANKAQQFAMEAEQASILAEQMRLFGEPRAAGNRDVREGRLP
jgi:hypothetical protein